MERAAPIAIRVAAGFLALLVGAWFLVLEPVAYAQFGCNVSALVVVLAALPLVAFLAAYALAPETLRRPLERYTRATLGDAGHGAALLLMACTLFFVLGVGGLLSASATLEAATSAACATPPTAPTTGEALLVGVTINFAIFTLPVLFYVGFVHGHGPAGILRELGLRREGAPRAAGIGALAAVVFIVLLVLVETAILQVAPKEYLDNPRALEMARMITPLGALVLAVASGVGEEVFFRGFLQPRAGLLATSVIFALAHVSYGSVSEVVVVFVLSLVLGLLYQRTRNLAAPITMHFTFNLVNLIAATYVT